MNNEELKLPDEFFQQGLENFEAPYSEGAWEEMRDLLDKTDRKRPFLFWFRRNKKTTITLITITMTTTALISALALIFSNTDKMPADPSKNTGIAAHTENNKNAQKNSQQIPANNEYGTTENTMGFTAGSHIEKPGTINLYTADETTPDAETDHTVMAPVAESMADAATNSPAGDEGEPTKKPAKAKNAEKGDVKTSDAAGPDCVNKIAETGGKEIIKEVGQTNSFTKSSDPSTPSYTTFRGPWMGIHFTTQMPQTPALIDSNRQNYGFNFQFMSSNLLGRQDFGAHLGLDFGALWYGRTKNHGVVLDNSSLDSGFTRLSTHSFDFFARGHFEYARFRVKPYINGFAGPRIFATSQYTEAYRHKVDYENSNNTNAFTSASLMYGGAIGARVAITKHVSLDARWEIMRGTETVLVDLDKSKINSLSTYDLSKFRVAPEYQQIKVGVLFDLWDGEEEREYEPIQNDEVVQVSEYYYFDSATSQYIKVNCRCKETPAGTDSTGSRSASFFETPVTPGDTYEPGSMNKTGEWKNTNPRTNRSGRNSSSFPEISTGSSSGSGKGAFPGIKSGGSGVKIKN